MMYFNDNLATTLKGHYIIVLCTLLGSFPEGADVVSLTNVGIVNHVTFHDLKLQDGHSYYGTVKGILYDYVSKQEK